MNTGGSQFKVDGKSHYERNKAAYLAKNAARREAIRNMLRELKLASGCVDCGYDKHPAALDFDHVTGDKTIGPAAMITQGWSNVRIMEELRKCVVRCSNCHRVVTYERRVSVS